MVFYTSYRKTPIPKIARAMPDINVKHGSLFYKASALFVLRQFD